MLTLLRMATEPFTNLVQQAVIQEALWLPGDQIMSWDNAADEPAQEYSWKPAKVSDR